MLLPTNNSADRLKSQRQFLVLIGKDPDVSKLHKQLAEFSQNGQSYSPGNFVLVDGANANQVTLWYAHSPTR
jgi:hypothetical protein